MGNPAIGLKSYKKFSISVDLAINEFVGYDSFWNDLFESFKRKIIKFLTIEKYIVAVETTKEVM